MYVCMYVGKNFFLQLFYAVVLCSCFMQLFYAVVLCSCSMQLFYAIDALLVVLRFQNHSVS